ncbi:DNA polymerase/3'-5' exonuclease PolX [Candidatus Parcubacteria bacterium]|nr:MAG: DNA polymerase/3'-5' exonuclease PolX [Candidatus Parcubacteria bacterium]
MNQELARIFEEMAVLLDMEGVAFKPRAFERAAEALANADEDVRETYRRGGLKALEEIPDVGRGIAERIEEFVKTRHVKDYERMKQRVPVDIAGLRSVAGLGPKKILLLWKKLKIRTVADLEKAAKAGKIRGIPTLGLKTEQNILKGITFVEETGKRFLLGEVWPMAASIQARLERISEVERVMVAGSIRRMKETIGDVDILAISKKPGPIMDAFCRMPEVGRVYAKGDTKSMVRLRQGLDVDLRVVPAASFGAALNYFTGSKEHNVALREIAVKKGWKLNEYGLFAGKRRVAGKTEEELYGALGLRYIEPEMRENRGEIEAARHEFAVRNHGGQARGKISLPKNLVGYGDLRGDLQVQTDWTDGAHSILQMAEAAKKAGLEYICITDHTRSLAMTGGSDERKLERQMVEIDRINKKISGITVLRGAEVNIMADGTLDIADRTLAKLDCVGAAVHAQFRMTKAEMTKRIVRAMENPHVDILFHPTGRLINRRAAYDVDMDAIIAAAKRTGTILEIDAHPDRLDLKDDYVRKAVDAGAPLVIDSDAHAMSGFAALRYGIGQARRGWAERSDIINTRPLRDFLKCLKGGRS